MEDSGGRFFRGQAWCLFAPYVGGKENPSMEATVREYQDGSPVDQMYTVVETLISNRNFKRTARRLFVFSDDNNIGLFIVETSQTVNPNLALHDL